MQRADTATVIEATHQPMTDSIHIAVTSFSADAHAWFDWLRAELAAGRGPFILPTISPAVWRNGSGNSWRIVRTAEGIEVRPELENPFIQYGESPKVTAMAITPSGVAVELTCRTGRWVDRFPHDAFDLAALGHEMLNERGLPHDNLVKLFPSRVVEQTD